MTEPKQKLDPILVSGLLLFAWLGIFLAGMSAPPHILDNDQQRPAAYVLDLMTNGNWIVQRDNTGDIASKPPLWTWLSALFSYAAGEFNDWTFYLPGSLAVLGSAFLIYFAGAGSLGGWPALAAALMWLISGIAMKHVILARTDALFALLTFATALMIFYAGKWRRGWIAVYALAALATLTKGPLVLLLVLGGIPVLLWHNAKWSHEPARQFHWGRPHEHAIGAAVYLLLAGGWFLAAYADSGQALIDKMIGRELVQKVVVSDSGADGFGSAPWEPLLYFLSRSAPWSVLAAIALVRVWVQPPGRLSAALLLRFLAAYFLFGMVIFSLAAHKRPDHLVPLIPAGFALAGWEFSRWLIPRMNQRFFLKLIAGISVVCLIIAGFYQVQRSAERDRGARHLAFDVIASGGRTFPLTHVDSLFGVQYYLKTFRRNTDHGTAGELLDSEAAAFLVIRDLNVLPDDGWFVVAQTPFDKEEPFMRIISNREQLRHYPRMAFITNEWELEMQDLRLISRGDEEFRFRRTGEVGSVRVKNRSPARREIIITFTEGARHRSELAPGEEITLRTRGESG